MAELNNQEYHQDIITEIERRRSLLNQRLFNVYHSYRLAIGLALFAVASQTLVNTRLGSQALGLFQLGTLAYSAFALLLLASVRFKATQIVNEKNTALVISAVDIIWLTWLIHLSGGIGSGLGPLLLVSVAVGAILLEGRRTTFVAAIASIFLISEEVFLSWTSENVGDIFQAGIYGILYFAIAIIIRRFSSRVRTNEIVTLAQEAELADLENLNRQIIQRMRTGIVVVDRHNRVRLHNQSARSLMGVAPEHTFTTLPSAVLDNLSAWRENNSLRTPPFKAIESGSEIMANFSAIRADASGDITIFIEDTSEVQQQAQQLKLAELGTLSASIAHEVRNPLGAISHAAQLLDESTDLNEADRRLTSIITHHCERMNGVIENVLEMSRRRLPQPQQMKLHAAILEFTEQNRDSFLDAEINFTVTPPETTFRFDRSHFTQALTNLVDNGLRYSEENGHGRKIELQGGLDYSSERPYLNVIDFGTGVDADQVPSLFQPFSTTAIGGTGLGLYVCKELCDANRAQLSYMRTPIGASCFRILFAHPDRISR